MYRRYCRTQSGYTREAIRVDLDYSLEAKLQNVAPCVCNRSELKGGEQKARESGGTESGGTLRTLKAASIGRFLEYILRSDKGKIHF